MAVDSKKTTPGKKPLSEKKEENKKTDDYSIT